MRIKKVELKNWCQFSNMVIEDLPPTVFLFGWNGAGKTNILEAIRWALFGFCNQTDRRGAGVKKLIGTGAGRAEINVTVEAQGEDYVLACTIYRNDKTSEFVVITPDGELLDIKDRDAWWKSIKVKKSHAEICSNPTAFLLSREMSDALAEFLSGELPQEDFDEFMSVNGGWLKGYAERKRMTIKTVKDLSAIGAMAFEDRKEHKRELKVTMSDIEAIGTPPTPKDKRGTALGPAELPTVQGAHRKMTLDRDRLLEEKGAATAPRPQPVDPNEVKQVRAEVGALDQKIKTLQADAATAETALRDATTEHATIVYQHKQAMDRRDKLASQKETKCPTCGSQVDVKRLFKEADEECIRLAKEGDTVLMGIQPLRNKANSTKDELNPLERQRAVLADRLSVLENTPPPPPPPRDVKVIQAEIDGLELRLARTATLISEIQVLARLEDLNKTLAHQQKTVEGLNWAVKQFKDGEALKRLVGDQLADFCVRCNGAGLVDAGYEMDAKVDGKNIELQLRAPGSLTFYPLAQHSSGRQVLAAAAIAEAFAADGMLVALDDINHLDARVRKSLVLRLYQRTGSSVWCASAWQQPTFDEAIVEAMKPGRVLWVAPPTKGSKDEEED